MTLEPLLTDKEAADFLRTSVRTLRQACEDGDLDYVMVNEEERRFTMDQLKAFIEHRTVRAKPLDSQIVGNGRPGKAVHESSNNTENGAHAVQRPADRGSGQPESSHFLTEKDVAHILGISVRAVRKRVKEKKLRSIRLTKRKQVFTWALIDEFLQSEAGLNKMAPGGPYFDPRFLGPKNNAISVDESRSLLKELRKTGLSGMASGDQSL
jgi:excisionase family DNA binding protein